MYTFIIILISCSFLNGIDKNSKYIFKIKIKYCEIHQSKVYISYVLTNANINLTHTTVKKQNISIIPEHSLRTLPSQTPVPRDNPCFSC